MDAEITRRSGRRWGKQPDGGTEAVNDLFSADKSEDVEQAGAYQLSRDCHTDRMNQRSRLHTPSIGSKLKSRLVGAASKAASSESTLGAAKYAPAPGAQAAVTAWDY